MRFLRRHEEETEDGPYLDELVGDLRSVANDMRETAEDMRKTQKAMERAVQKLRLERETGREP